MLGLIYILFMPHLTGLVVREYGEFIANNALPRTPMFVIMGTMIIVCAINVRLGIEVVGRTAQIFVTLVIVLLALIFVLLIGELNPAQLFPFMENGPLPVLEGAMAPGAWFSEYIVIAFLMPYVNRKKNGTHSIRFSDSDDSRDDRHQCVLSVFDRRFDGYVCFPGYDSCQIHYDSGLPAAY